MFLIIWGFKTYTKTLAMLNLACRNGHVAAHRLVKVTRKFTIFFIPLFPVSTKYVSVCAGCGLQLPWDKETADAAVAQASAEPPVPLAMDPVAAPLSPGIAPPPGWYADPAGGTGMRYWDGATWTESVHDS
jgi:hypothetical protein